MNRVMVVIALIALPVTVSALPPMEPDMSFDSEFSRMEPLDQNMSFEKDSPAFDTQYGDDWRNTGQNDQGTMGQRDMLESFETQLSFKDLGSSALSAAPAMQTLEMNGDLYREMNGGQEQSIAADEKYPCIKEELADVGQQAMSTIGDTSPVSLDTSSWNLGTDLIQ